MGISFVRMRLKDIKKFIKSKIVNRIRQIEEEKVMALCYMMLPISVVVIIGTSLLMTVFKVNGGSIKDVDDVCVKKIEERTGINVDYIDDDIVHKLCSKNGSEIPASVAQAGEKVSFGTLTFDNETRIWVLSNFIVPEESYSFSYSDGREWALMDSALWTLEGDSSNWGNINGEPFSICFDTTSVMCKTPVIVRRYMD